MSKVSYVIGLMLFLCAACSAGKGAGEAASSVAPAAAETAERPQFDADSAFSFVETLMAFGPRVPNTEAHRRSGDWLASRLRGFGWNVIEQHALLTAFDGTPLRARNIFASINPDKPDRLLLLAHWDCRPWADRDPDPDKRHLPVPGANDGASGVGVLLEIARQLGLQDSDAAVDILFVDAEDWGSDSVEDSWALGTKYFAENPPVEGYSPRAAILLDMVGSPDARFGPEYFSARSNPQLLQQVWTTAKELGYGNLFHTDFGGAVTDDHVQLIAHGIPAIDIIDYRDGFDPVWHTTADTIDNISPQTLRGVGETIIATINSSKN